MPAILDVAIGTVFIFLLFSLVISALNELILSTFDQRAKFLHMGLQELFGEEGREWRKGFWNWLTGGLRARVETGPWTRKLYEHGLINSLSRTETKDPADGTSPSYIPAGAFVTALLDIIRPTNPAAPDDVSRLAKGTVLWAVATLSKIKDTAIQPLSSKDTTDRDAAVQVLHAFVDALPEYAKKMLTKLEGRDITSITDIQELADIGQQVKELFLAANPTPPVIPAEVIALAKGAIPWAIATLNRIKIIQLGKRSRRERAERRRAMRVLHAVVRALPEDATKMLKTLGGRDITSIINSQPLVDIGQEVTDLFIDPATAEPTAANIQRWIDGIQHDQLRTSLQALFVASGRDVGNFKTALEGWFNASMDRVTGWYKRFAQKWMILIGFVLAVLLNVDTIAIVRVLSYNPNLAKVVASQAETYVRENGRPLTADQTAQQRQEKWKARDEAKREVENLRANARKTLHDQLNANREPVDAAKAAGEKGNAEKEVKALAEGIGLLEQLLQTMDWDDAKLAAAKEQFTLAKEQVMNANLEAVQRAISEVESVLNPANERLAAAQSATDALKAYDDSVAKLSATGIPIGWRDEDFGKLGLKKFHSTPKGVWNEHFLTEVNVGVLFPMLLGWFLTALAASLGAPFWFDTLNKIINIRNAGRPPGQKDATSTPTQPPPANLDKAPK